MVRAFARGVMGRRIDELFLVPSHCSTTGVIKAIVCVLPCMWDGAYKRTLAVNWKE